MLAESTIVLYTSSPSSRQMLTLVSQLKEKGHEVFLRPLSQLEVKKKAIVAPSLQSSLASVHPN